MGRYADYDPDAPRRPIPGSTVVRTARAADAEAITRITLERGSQTGPDVGARIRKEIAGLQLEGRWTVLVAEVGGEVVGFGRVRHLTYEADELPRELPEGWYLAGVIVDPAHRRRGLGEALTRARVEHVAALGCDLYCVMNRANRASLDLHVKLGFEPFASGFTYPRAGLEPQESVAYRQRLSSAAPPSH